MTPAALKDGEVQYYASPVLVKNTRYYATLTNRRLLIEGPKTHEFSVTDIQGAYPELLEGKDPGLKLIISTRRGQRDIIFAFPLEEKFKKGEQTAWTEAVEKATGGEKPFASGTFEGVETNEGLGEAHPRGIRFNPPADGGAYGTPAAGVRADQQPVPAPIVFPAGPAASSPAAPVSPSPSLSSSPASAAAPADSAAAQQINLIRGETIAVSTAGVRVKRTFYTAYLTNLRLILQNNLGKIGREFAIAEIKDAAEMESDAGEPEIAVSVGTQTGLKQMLIVFPTAASRTAWMQELRNRLPRRVPPAPQDAAVSASRIGTFTPATNERVTITTPGVHIKNRLVVLHLTSTRFVVDSANGLVGEFAVSALSRFSRMASELGEPGISLTIASGAGQREMHLIFPAMNDREAWMDALQAVIPDEAPGYGGAAGYAAGYGAAGYGGAAGGYSGGYGSNGYGAPGGQYTASSGGQQYTVTQVSPRVPANPQIIECPACGAQNPVSEQFCAICGSALHGGYRVPAGGAGAAGAAGAAGYGGAAAPAGRGRVRGDDPLYPQDTSTPRSSRPPRAPRAPRQPRVKGPRPEYSGSIMGFLTRPQEAFAYHAREGPKEAFPFFLLFGGIWAVITAVLIAFLLPAVADIDPAEFPVFAELADNVLLLVIFIIILWILWIAAVLLQSVITSGIARLTSPSVRIPEGISIVMRSSMAFALVGWIPIIGMFAASIWSAVATTLGLRTTQDVSTGAAAAAAAVGVIAVYLLLFIIGGGFA